MCSVGKGKTENLGHQWSEKSIFFFFLKVSADLLLYLRHGAMAVFVLHIPFKVRNELKNHEIADIGPEPHQNQQMWLLEMSEVLAYLAASLTH